MTYDPQAQPGPLGEPLLTCREAAGLLAIKPAWIYDAARSGRLPCVCVGRPSDCSAQISKPSSPNNARHRLRRSAVRALCAALRG
jgi:hypothetical protein